MTEREKLVGLLDNFGIDDDWYTNTEIADYLLANGVRLEPKQATSDENKRWIPVSERLPEDGEVVLVWCKIGKMFVGYRRRLYGGNWYWYILTARDSTKHITYKVTYWMPLPNPPEEENK